MKKVITETEVEQIMELLAEHYALDAEVDKIDFDKGFETPAEVELLAEFHRVNNAASDWFAAHPNPDHEAGLWPPSAKRNYWHEGHRRFIERTTKPILFCSIEID